MNNLEFIYPQMFMLFILPIIIYLYNIKKKRNLKNSLFSPEILKKLRNSSGGIKIKTRNIVIVLSTLLMITALARPVIKDGKVEIESKSVDIVIALDISKSMLAKDRFPNRLDFSKRKIIEILKGLEKNRVGIIAFANRGYTVSPLTFDKLGVEYLVRHINSKNISEAGTSIKRLLESTNIFLKDNSDKLLIIFTDGGDSQSYSDEIAFANKSGIKIFVIGVGSKSGAPIEIQDGKYLENNGSIVITKFNSAIESLGSKTGGLFMNSLNGNQDIQYILDEVLKIDSNEVKKDEVPIYIEFFIYPLILSFILFLPIFYSLPKITILAIFLFLPNVDLKADILDWWYLDKAKENFYDGNYSEAIKNYSQIEQSDEIKFNIGNSFYLDQNYSEAIKNYSQIENKSLLQKSLFNIGNSHIQLEDLKKAIQIYEKALKLGENPKIRENLEWAKNKLKKEKKKSQESEEKDNKKEKSNSDNSEKNKNQESERSKEEKDSKSKDSEKTDGEKPENQDKVDSKKGETENNNKKDDSQDFDENLTKDDKVQNIDKNLTEERDLNSSEKDMIQSKQESISENKFIEEQKILEMLNRTKGGTKIYSIPLNIPVKGDNQNAKPW